MDLSFAILLLISRRLASGSVFRLSFSIFFAFAFYAYIVLTFRAVRSITVAAMTAAFTHSFWSLHGISYSDNGLSKASCMVSLRSFSSNLISLSILVCVSRIVLRTSFSDALIVDSTSRIDAVTSF